MSRLEPVALFALTVTRGTNGALCAHSSLVSERRKIRKRFKLNVRSRRLRQAGLSREAGELIVWRRRQLDNGPVAIHRLLLLLLRIHVPLLRLLEVLGLLHGHAAQLLMRR